MEIESAENSSNGDTQSSENTILPPLPGEEEPFIFPKTTKEDDIDSPNINKEDIVNPNINKEDIGSPNINNDDIDSPNINKEDIYSPNINKGDFDSPNINKEDNGSPNINKEDIGSPNINKDDIGSPNINKNDIGSPNINKDDIGSPNINKDNNEKPKSVLSKYQAKSRLKAFSLLKQNYLNLKKKKEEVSTPVKEEKEQDESNNSKKNEKPVVKKPSLKSSNPNDKAKAVIEEIESIKKQLLHDTIHKFDYPKSLWKDRSRTHEKSRNRKSYRRSYSHDNNVEYPKNWDEFNVQNMNFSQISEMNMKKQKPKARSYDFRKHLQYRTGEIKGLKMKTLAGNSAHVPPSFIRYTTTSPTISYSVNFNRNKFYCLTRNEALKSMSGVVKNAFNKLLEGTETVKFEENAIIPCRKWYPKAIFPTLESNPDCKVLEPSLGLKFLQNYSDEEYEEKDSQDSQTNNKKDDEKDTQNKFKLKYNENSSLDNELLNDLIARDEESFIQNDVIDELKYKNKDKEDMNNDNSMRTEKKESKKTTISSDNETDEEKQHKSKKSKKKKRKNKNVTKKRSSKKLSNEKNSSEVINEAKASPNNDFVDDETQSATEQPINKNGTRKDKTPDTEEYHSRWESEEENATTAQITKDVTLNQSWESDEEVKPSADVSSISLFNDRNAPKRVITEASLEMPLNLGVFSSRSRIEPPKINGSLFSLSEASLDINKLIEERKNLEMERRLLEIEKQKLAERKKHKGKHKKRRDSDSDSSSSDDESNKSKKKRKRKEKKKKENSLSELEDSSKVFDLSNNSINIKQEKISDDEFDANILSEKSFCSLETEYEEFMKAVSGTKIKKEQETPQKLSSGRKRKESSSTSASSSDSSESDSSSSEVSDESSSSIDLNLENEPKTDIISNKTNIRNIGGLVNKDKEDVILPIPVPAPNIDANVNRSLSPVSKIADSTTSPVKKINLVPVKYLMGATQEQQPADAFLQVNSTKVMNNEFTSLESSRKRKFNFSAMSLPNKRQLLDNSIFGSDDEPEEEEELVVESRNEKKEIEELEIEEKETEQKQEEIVEGAKIYFVGACDTIIPHQISPVKRKDNSPSINSINDNEKDLSPSREKHKSPSHKSSHKNRDSKRWDISPRRGKNSSPRRSTSPRHSKRKGSPSRRDGSPKRRNQSPRRNRRSYDDSPNRDSVVRRFRDRNSSPNDRGSPGYDGRRFDRRSYEKDHQYRSRYANEPSSHHLPPSDGSKEPIQVTLQRLAGMEEYQSDKSPVNSPMDGLKRSLADSTISDDQLLEQNIEEYSDSPNYTASNRAKKLVETCSSPRRISLDDRINQVLGIENKEMPKAIHPSEQYLQNQYQYNEQYYDHYAHGQFNSIPQYHQVLTPIPEAGKSKVLQVGNVLEVVPTEDVVPTTQVNNSTPQVVNPPKILQVGNMLQIVPTADVELPLPVPEIVQQTIVPPPSEVVIKETVNINVNVNAEAIMKQKLAEHQAEREKRRLARELKRKEKEDKRREREKRRQLKLKINSDMIKRALLLETEGAASLGDEENQEPDEDLPVHWPPIPIVVSNVMKPAGKGILLTDGFSNLLKEGVSEKKFVKFADGIRPGEGTSPSGGEELSSPPPQPVKLPKEKRYTKTKKPKKIKFAKKKGKSVKKLIENNDEDNLPPPSPPPGSPPPHLFPPRIKTHNINNLQPNYNPALPAISNAINLVSPSYRIPMQSPTLSTMNHQHINQLQNTVSLGLGNASSIQYTNAANIPLQQIRQGLPVVTHQSNIPHGHTHMDGSHL